MRRGNQIIGNVIFEVKVIDGKTAFIQIMETSGETDVRLKGRTFQVSAWHNFATVGVDKTGKHFECFEYRLIDYQICLEKGDRLNALINHSEDMQVLQILAVAEEAHLHVADKFVQEWKTSRQNNGGLRVKDEDRKTGQPTPNAGIVSLEEALQAAEAEKTHLTDRQRRMLGSSTPRTKKAVPGGSELGATTDAAA